MGWLETSGLLLVGTVEVEVEYGDNSGSDAPQNVVTLGLVGRLLAALSGVNLSAIVVCIHQSTV
jgi:hypothetical protein